MVKFVGAGLELRIIQEQRVVGQPTVTTVLSSSVDTSDDQSDAWQEFQMFTGSISTDLQALYVFEGRLNGATSASIEFCTMELLERR